METFELIKHSKKLMNNKQFEKALKPLLSIVENKVSNEVLETKYILLSLSYYNLCNYTESLSWANQAAQINKASEYASVTKCGVYLKMSQFEKAYLEMKAFLDLNPPLIYRAIIMQLKEDISKKLITEPTFIEHINILVKEHDL